MKTIPARLGPMTCRVQQVDGGHIVRLAGDVDVASAPRLQAVLDRLTTGAVIVDVSAVPFIDSCGLTVLALAHQRLAERNVRLSIVGRSAFMSRLLAITGL